MAKTLESLIFEAEKKKNLWLSISIDPQALKDRNKTEQDAVALFSYFEGRYDALVEVSRL